MKQMLVFVSALLLSFAAQAQQSPTNDDKIAEVYPADFFTDNAELRQMFHDLLDHRIEYVQLDYSPDEKHPLLSTAPLSNKYNQSMIRDVFFDPNTFNPLKYNLQFFSKIYQIYRIDGTNYLLVIKPQTVATN